jgi:nitrogen fixation NifU-like protein
MKNDIEELARQLQDKIDKIEETAFSKKVINEYRKPYHFGSITQPDTKAEIKGPCGDTMQIQLRLSNDIIKEAYFVTDGCGPTIACGSMLMKIIEGKHLSEIRKLTEMQLIQALDGLPSDHTHCATLTMMTLRQAIKQLHIK